MTSVASASTRIERWLSTSAPSLHSALRGPAREGDVYDVEATLGQRLPEPFKDSLTHHDGQDIRRPLVFGDWALLPLRFALSEWKELKGALRDGEISELNHMTVWTTGPVRRRWWDPCWFPFAHDECGNYLCLDLNPPGGARESALGQVVVYAHDSGHREVAASSFTAWLSSMADLLESGKYEVMGAPDDAYLVDPSVE